MENVFYFPFLFKGGRVTLTVEESVEMLQLLSGFDSDSVRLYVTVVANGQFFRNYSHLFLSVRMMC